MQSVSCLPSVKVHFTLVSCMPSVKVHSTLVSSMPSVKVPARLRVAVRNSTTDSLYMKMAALVWGKKGHSNSQRGQNRYGFVMIIQWMAGIFASTRNFMRCIYCTKRLQRAHIDDVELILIRSRMYWVGKMKTSDIYTYQYSTPTYLSGHDSCRALQWTWKNLSGLRILYQKRETTIQQIRNIAHGWLWYFTKEIENTLHHKRSLHTDKPRSR